MRQYLVAFRLRIFLLAFLPWTIISLLMFGGYIGKRYYELNQQLLTKAQPHSEQQMAVMALLLAHSEPKDLQSVISLMLNDNEVRAVSLLNKNGQEILHAGPALMVTKQPAPLPETETTWFHQDWIIQTTNTISDSNSRTMGWLIIEYSFASLFLTQYRLLALSLLMVAIGLGCTLFISLKLSNAITQPLDNIARVINRIRRGYFDTPLNANPNSIFYEMELAINEVLNASKNTNEKMTCHIDQYNKELQETLETIEIQNIELDLARKEALKASRSKSQFLANMSHEIRTPLNGIIGFSNLMFNSGLTSQQYDYVSAIEKSSKGLLTMLNQILDFSKMEAGKLKLDPQNECLQDIIEEVIRFIAPAAHSKSLELAHFVYDHVPEYIVIDGQRLKQILTNLITNAIKFTRCGSIAVRVMSETDDNDQLTLRFTITDTGIGLSPEQQQDLFQAFTQIDSSSTRTAGGSGLGLAICKSLVEQMGGEIGVKSDLGKGSVFWFTIKTRSGHPVKMPSEPEPLAGKQVLLIEPNELSRLSTSHLLTKLGAELTTNSRFTSSSHIADAQYAFVFISLETARTTIAQLNRQFPAASIIVLSTTVDNLILPDTVKTVLKPVTMQRLRALIQRKDDHLCPPLNRTLNTLVVDDNPINLKLLSSMLNHQALHVAQTGLEALEMCQNYTFDIIFMDIQMPVMDGLEATQKIRSEQKNRRTPIVAVTAHALADEKKTLLKSGFDDYLSKPVSEKQMLAILNKWTQTSQHSFSKHEKTTRETTRSNALHSSMDTSEHMKKVAKEEALADEMLAMLHADLDEDLRILKSGWQANDFMAVLERVHRLHGACRYCEVVELESACNQLETRLKTYKTLANPEIKRGFQQLIESLVQLKASPLQKVREFTTVF